MTTQHENDASRGTVTSLREMPQDLAPPRDLWAGIASQIALEPQVQERTLSSKSQSEHSAEPQQRQLESPGWAQSKVRVLRPRAWPTRVLALAAVVSALAVGIWIGRSALPTGTSGTAPPPAAASGSPDMLPASFVTSPRYVKERAALLASFEQQIRALPPESRDKVVASLAAIRKSMDEIRAALGREPGNALLQELLVNTYQDEMRVLTAVHEAGDARKEI